MKRAIVAAAAFLAMACGGSDAPHLSHTPGAWTLQQNQVVCEGAEQVRALADGTTACTWLCVPLESRLGPYSAPTSITWIIQPDGSGAPTFGPADCG